MAKAKRKRKPSRKGYPGHLERRGAGYRWHVSIGGQRHKRRFATDDRDEAEDLARSEFAKLKAEAGHEEAGLRASVRVSELFTEFEALDLPPAPNAQRAYRDSLKPIRKYFVEQRGDPRVRDVLGPDVVRFLDWRGTHRMGKGKRPVSARTVAKDRAVLHRIFSRAERRGYVQGNPVAMTDAPKGDSRQPVLIEDDHFEELLKACDGRPMFALYVLALNETGARCESEILRLRWEDVDLEGGFIHIVSGRDGHRTKGGRNRWTPMTPRLAKAMRAHFAAYRFATYEGEPTPWVFHHLTTRRRHRAGARVGSFYDAFKRAVKRAGLPAQLVQHDLRHRRVTTWLAEGRDVVHVKEAVGHSDLRTTMGYTHLAREHLRSLVEAPQRPSAKRMGTA